MERPSQTPNFWVPADASQLSRQGVTVLTAFLKREDFQTGRRNRGPVERIRAKKEGSHQPRGPPGEACDKVGVLFCVFPARTPPHRPRATGHGRAWERS